jgi:hypothetical protein
VKKLLCGLLLSVSFTQGVPAIADLTTKERQGIALLHSKLPKEYLVILKHYDPKRKAVLDAEVEKFFASWKLFPIQTKETVQQLALSYANWFLRPSGYKPYELFFAHLNPSAAGYDASFTQDNEDGASPVIRVKLWPKGQTP